MCGYGIFSPDVPPEGFGAPDEPAVGEPVCPHGFIGACAECEGAGQLPEPAEDDADAYLPRPASQPAAYFDAAIAGAREGGRDFDAHELTEAERGELLTFYRVGLPAEQASRALLGMPMRPAIMAADDEQEREA